MVVHGSRVLGVLAFVVPLSCGPSDEPAAEGAAGSSGGKGGGGSAGGGGSVTTGGTAGKGGVGGTAGTATGGRAGSSATGGSDTVGGSGGSAGGDSVGGTGGTGGSGTAGIAGDSGSSGDSGEAGATNGVTIAWNDDGVISTDTNDFGMQGTWFFETDCDDANAAGLDCTMPDAALQGPDGQPGWTTSADRVCAKGLASQVNNDPMTGMPAYEIQWGVRLGFELNGTSSGTRGTYDAVMHGLRGLRFDISTPNSQPPTVRVNFVTNTTEFNEHFIEVALPAVGQDFLFDDAFQGDWVTTPVPLNKTALTAVTFQVFTNSVSQKPFDFCISNASVVQ